MLRLISIYIVSSLLGLGFSRGLHKVSFSQEADNGLFLCFVFGTIVSLLAFLIFWKRIASLPRKNILAGVLGLVSYLPGYVIAYGYTVFGV